jgi:hypothetical protein
MKLHEQQFGWRLKLDDCRITRLQIDYRLGLDLSDAKETMSLIIETPCILHIGGASHDLVPDDVTSLGPGLRLFNVEVAAVEIKRTGVLTVFLGDRGHLEVPPHEKYESWQLSLLGRFLLVGGPGGAVSIFLENEREAPPDIQ